MEAVGLSCAHAGAGGGRRGFLLFLAFGGFGGGWLFVGLGLLSFGVSLHFLLLKTVLVFIIRVKE